MADRHHHIFLLDQILIILIDKLVRNFGATRIIKPFTRSGKLFKDDFVYTLYRAQNIQIVSNLAGKLASLICQLFALHSGQTLQTQIKNGARLRF